MTIKHTDYVLLIKENLHKIELNKPYMFTKLCDTLNIKRTSSKYSISAILKALDSLAIRNMEGKKHIITEIRTEQLEIIDNRGLSEGSRGNNDKFSSNIQNVFLYRVLDKALDELINKTDLKEMYRRISEDTQYHVLEHAFKVMPFKIDGENTIIMNISKHDIACISGIRNRENYQAYTKTPNYFHTYFDLDPNVTRATFWDLNNKSYTTVNTLISKLVKEGLAVVSEEFEIEVISLYDKKGFMIDEEYDKQQFKYNKDNKILMYEIANTEQKNLIKLSRLEVAKNMGYKNLSQLYNSNNVKAINEFHKKLNDFTREKYGIYSSRPFVRLTTSISLIKEHLKKFENMTLEEFMQKGYNSFKDSVMSKVHRNINLYDDAETRSKIFERKLRAGVENPVIRYALIQQEDFYLEQTDRFVESILNDKFKKIPCRSTDIADKRVSKNSSYIVYRLYKEEY